jgi:hypothetical protein
MISNCTVVRVTPKNGTTSLLAIPGLKLLVCSPNTAARTFSMIMATARELTMANSGGDCRNGLKATFSTAKPSNAPAHKTPMIAIQTGKESLTIRK